MLGGLMLGLGGAVAAPALAQDAASSTPNEPAPADVQVGQPATAAPQMVAPPKTFPIYAIDVVGVTSLPAAVIEKTVYPFMGENKSPSDVEAARKAVQDAYAKAGFEAVVVEVPPQPQEDFAAGLVRIAVGEAPVAKVTVTGAKHHSEKLVLQQMPSVQPGKPLNFKDLQRDIEVANRFPDREVVPAFDAGEQPGTIAINLKVRDSLPLHASVELSNDHSPNTKPLRLTGSARYTNLWGVGHTVSLGYSVAPQRRDDSEAYFGSYSLPFLGSQWTLLVSGYKSNSNIAALGGTNVLGNGYQIGAKAIWRVPTASDYHAFNIGFDYKDFKQKIALSGQQISTAPIRYVPLTIGYNFSTASDKWSLDLGVNSTLGLRIMKRFGCFVLDNSNTCLPEDQFTNRAADAQENFAHLNVDATLTAMLGHDWVSQVRISGQYADSPLVTNEQFALGGLSNIRGYLQSEAVGDRGINGSIELRAPSLATQLGSFVDELRVYAFADGGIVSGINPLPDTQAVYRIASIGGGLRVKVFKHFSGDFLVALPLVGTSDTRANDPRFTFSVKGEF
jgi:hemolysin activation/secretion protein